MGALLAIPQQYILWFQVEAYVLGLSKFSLDSYYNTFVPNCKLIVKFQSSFLDRISILKYYANSADPVQTPRNAASDQGLHYLLTGMSMQNTVKVKLFTRKPCN